MMYTAKGAEALVKRLKADGASKPDIVRQLAELCIGWPYVYAAAGEMCTPEWRKNRMQYSDAKYAAAIRDACPVLNGENPKIIDPYNGNAIKTISCAGCKWDGCRCFDCRGFTRWLLAQAEITLAGGGATSQWDTASNWVAKGTIDTMPTNLVCCVFKRKGGKMIHTGMAMGDGGGGVIHCSTTVKRGNAFTDYSKWTHWAIPKGMYTDAELREAGIKVQEGENLPTLRRGSRGEAVTRLQQLLNEQTNAGLKVDGIFGANTESAVQHFQELHGLQDDGIVGPKTWGALGVSERQAEDQYEDMPSNTADQPEALPHRPPDAQGVWDKLMNVVNGNPYAAAGIMGNLYAESSLIPNNLQGNGNKALSVTDEEYTAAVDSGAYTAEQFASDGFGYGLCQWTYKTRKAGLLQCAKKCNASIGDAGVQIVFLREELQSSFRATLEKLLAAKSVREASDAFMLGFEKPKNQSEENQARRAALGQRYFDQFAEVGKTSEAEAPSQEPEGVFLTLDEWRTIKAAFSAAENVLKKHDKP